MMQTCSRRCLLAAGLSLFATAASAATSYNFTTFAVTGALQTNPVAINGGGTAIGYSVDSQYKIHGFIYDGGKLTSLNVPKAGSTYAQGINKAGTIVGTYIDSAKVSHGYIYQSGRFTTVDLPGSTFTALTGINDAGVILGAGTDGSGNTELFTYAQGNFTTLLDNGLSPTGVAINASGAVAGWYPADPQYETAFRVVGGTATAITSPKLVFFTASYAINKHGVVVGQAAKTDGTQAGFIWQPGGHVRLLPAPGSSDSFLLGINDAGVMVGSSYNSSGLASGYVYDKGSFTALNVSGSGVQETHALAINNAGTVLGDYVDSTGTKAFVAVPSQ